MFCLFCNLTGGLVASRIVSVPGASEWFKGGVVAYDSQVKVDLLGVPEGPVVSEAAAMAMADGVRRRLGADVGLATTGVAGPAEQEGQPPGTVWLGVALGGDVSAIHVRLPGDRDRVRQLSVISLMDRVRRQLLALPSAPSAAS
jgi:nicotinamide-nucleotide amidase